MLKNGCSHAMLRWIEPTKCYVYYTKKNLVNGNNASLLMLFFVRGNRM